MASAYRRGGALGPGKSFPMRNWFRIIRLKIAGRLAPELISLLLEVDKYMEQQDRLIKALSRQLFLLDSDLKKENNELTK